MGRRMGDSLDDRRRKGFIRNRNQNAATRRYEGEWSGEKRKLTITRIEWEEMIEVRPWSHWKEEKRLVVSSRCGRNKW